MKKIIKLFVIGTFVIYLLALIYLVFLRQRGYWYDMSILDYALRQINIIPFRTIIKYIQAIFDGSMNLDIPLTNLVGNLLMFLPMGIYLPLLFKNINSWKKYIASIVIILFFIEIVQLLTMRGSFDIDDLILNITGAVVGFGVYRKIAIKRFNA